VSKNCTLFLPFFQRKCFHDHNIGPSLTPISVNWWHKTKDQGDPIGRTFAYWGEFSYYFGKIFFVNYKRIPDFGLLFYPRQKVCIILTIHTWIGIHFCRYLDILIWGRCYDHNFRRFFLIFGEKFGVFLKYQCYDQLFSKFCFVLSQKCQFFRKNFRRKYLKNHNIGPRSPCPGSMFTV
jgi:hypothetical protein